MKIHSSSEVFSKNIGEDTTVWQNCVILEGATIGSNCNINCNVFIENKVVIGNNVTIKPGVQIWDGIHISHNVFIGPNVTFCNDHFPRSKKYLSAAIQTFVHDGVSIGANATILPGLELGSNCFIGAGSVLTKSTPPNTVWFGNPAVIKGVITDGEIILY
jgi:acetyltransferase-like isoleucine patch superfamily enzyme